MKIKVVESVLKANDAVAAENRRIMRENNLLAINIMSSPGSGKTTLLEKTIPALEPDYDCAVLVGDLQTTRDAERLGKTGCQVIQINTGRGCHLDPTQVAEGLNSLDLKNIHFLFIENVGNMVCPASFDLGEHLRVVLLSIPEGYDKAGKYPTLFQQADAILLTKVDLIGVLEFDRKFFQNDLKKLNTSSPVFETSSYSGTGLDDWLTWLKNKHADLKSR